MLWFRLGHVFSELKALWLVSFFKAFGFPGVFYVFRSIVQGFCLIRKADFCGIRELSGIYGFLISLFLFHFGATCITG
ncbi:MAG: hypothetical protein JXR70_13440 [Spirochaetales bacterium]|nr:hypothetical protein [Spirochaetales bacterium]